MFTKKNHKIETNTNLEIENSVPMCVCGEKEKEKYFEDVTSQVL